MNIDGGGGGGGNGVEIDISQTAGPNSSDFSYYYSGGEKIQVQKVTVNNAQGGVSTEWIGYKHSRSPSGQTFKLLKITHSDQTMQSTDGKLKEDMSEEFSQVTAVYVYYKDPTLINEPRVICISVDGETSKNKWYKAGSNANDWSIPTNRPTSNPDVVTETELTKAVDGSQGFTPPGTSNYIIKLDKRPKDNGIQYRTKDTITVTQAPINNVPGGYIAYEHRVSISGTNKIILQHNGNTLRDVTEDQPVTKIFVYYHKDNDREHQFPLIVCVDTGSDTRKYYKRGQTWDEAQNLANINPESEEAGRSDGPLKDELDNLKDIHEIILEKTEAGNGYESNAGGTDITVEKQAGGSGPVPQGYVAYTHGGAISGTVKFKHNDVELKGLPDTSVTINDSTNKLWVYYQEGQHGNPIIDKPLLIYVYKGSTDTWYHRGSKWELTTDVTGNPNDSASTTTGIGTQAENLFKGKLTRQSTFKELNCFNDKGVNITLTQANTEMSVSGTEAEASSSGSVVTQYRMNVNTINTQLTDDAKQTLKDAHTQLGELTTAANANNATQAETAANGAVTNLKLAKNQLTGNDAKEWIDALIDKYKGIGSHMTPHTAAQAKNWNLG